MPARQAALTAMSVWVGYWFRILAIIGGRPVSRKPGTLMNVPGYGLSGGVIVAPPGAGPCHGRALKLGAAAAAHSLTLLVLPFSHRDQTFGDDDWCSSLSIR